MGMRGGDEVLGTYREKGKRAHLGKWKMRDSCQEVQRADQWFVVTNSESGHSAQFWGLFQARVSRGYKREVDGESRWAWPGVLLCQAGTKMRENRDLRKCTRKWI